MSGRPARFAALGKGADVTRLDVTDELVGRLIGEVTPLVEAATGWAIAAEGVRPRVLPKDMGYEAICLGRLRGAGIDVERLAPTGLMRRLLEYVIEGNALGAYEPSSEELLVVRENVDDSNLDGLRLVVSHELVHRGQHVRHPRLFARVDQMLRDLFAVLESEEAEAADILRFLEEIRPVMTLIESHAMVVQERIRRERFPDAVIESHFSLAGLLLRLFAGAKVRQYTEGAPAIAAALSRGEIDGLYEAL